MKKYKIKAWAFMFSENNSSKKYFATGFESNRQDIFLNKPAPIDNPFGLPNKWKPTKIEITYEI